MKGFVVLLATAAAMAFAGVAAAGNWSDPVLDTAAGQVAGHPVSVYCEDTWSTWISNEGDNVNGFTYMNSTTIWISPRQCEILHMLLNHEDVGTIFAASAILTLVHESVHQRGITDEGVTDCTALPLVPTIATTYFGITPTIEQATTTDSPVSIRVKLGPPAKHHAQAYRTITYTQTTTSYETIPNPWVDRLVVDAERWHKSKPAEYQGTC